MAHPNTKPLPTQEGKARNIIWNNQRVCLASYYQVRGWPSYEIHNRNFRLWQVRSQTGGYLLKGYTKTSLEPLTIGVTTVTIHGMEEPRVAHSVKIRLSILRKGKVAAVTQNRTLGQWLEEAIVEKIEREQKLNKEVEK